MNYPAYLWGVVIATIPAIQFLFLSILAFTVAERILPAEKNQPLRDYFSNFGYSAVYLLVTPLVMIVPSALISAAMRHFGPGVIELDLEHWRSEGLTWAWPVRNVVLPLAPLAIYDFFYYLHHRLQHTALPFWRIHRLHHSAASLNAMGAFRIHWLEEPMRTITMTLPTILLFDITPVQGAWIAAGLGQLALFIHANVRIPLGPLTMIFMGPQTHRIHHSREPRHAGKNFASVFPFWDILFGTFYRPQWNEWAATGLYNQREGRDAEMRPLAGWARELIWRRLFRSEAIRL